MVLTSPAHTSDSQKQPTIGFLMSISYFVSLCAKHASRVSTKLKAAKPSRNQNHCKSPKLSSVTSTPKKLFTQISNKAILFVHSNKKKVGEENDDVLGPEEFGDGGVWQKAILMGDKCQPLDFSGVIYYDSNGKQLDELPIRSPRASPMPGYLTRGK